MKIIFILILAVHLREISLSVILDPHGSNFWLSTSATLKLLVNDIEKTPRIVATVVAAETVTSYCSSQRPLTVEYELLQLPFRALTTVLQQLPLQRLQLLFRKSYYLKD